MPSSAACVAATFCASLPLLPRESKELDKYGPPPAVPASAPARAARVEFDELGFEFNEEGVRAFLFLISNDRGEATNLFAWAPLLNRLASWRRTALSFSEDKTNDSGFGRFQCSI